PMKVCAREGCGNPLPPKQKKFCSKDCFRSDRLARVRIKKEPVVCRYCKEEFEPYHAGDVTCSNPECKRAKSREDDRRQKGREPEASPLTRRCRSKLCIERFVPLNPQHFWHEPACRQAPPDMQWEVEDILAEEGALTLNASHLEL